MGSRACWMALERAAVTLASNLSMQCFPQWEVLTSGNENIHDWSYRRDQMRAWKVWNKWANSSWLVYIAAVSIGTPCHKRNCYLKEVNRIRWMKSQGPRNSLQFSFLCGRKWCILYLGRRGLSITSSAWRGSICENTGLQWEPSCFWREDKGFEGSRLNCFVWRIVTISNTREVSQCGLPRRWTLPWSLLLNKRKGNDENLYLTKELKSMCLPKCDQSWHSIIKGTNGIMWSTWQG